MSQISFLKMSAAGNDFIIVDARKVPILFNVSQISKLSRRNNVGCDQFIILKNSVERDVFMDIYNSDGTSSDACGNATRCVAFLLMEEIKKQEVVVETNAGSLSCKMIDDSIEVNMGIPRFDWDQIPVSHNMKTDSINIDGLEFSAVSMGNPHIVTFLNDELTDEEFFDLSPKLESHDYFPQKTNVEFVNKISDTQLSVRVWERGAGETMACGSGACAVGVIAKKLGIIDVEEVQVSFKGGDIYISQNDKGEVLMRGGATKIFYGIIDENFL